MHPESKTWHMSHYTLVNKQFRTSVEDVRLHLTTAGAIGTDHHLVRIKLKFHLKSRRKVIKSQLLRIDRKKFKNEQYKLAFQAQVNNRPQQQHTSSTSAIDNKYNTFVNNVRQASGVIFQNDQVGRKHKEWLTDEILDLVDKKAEAFLNWQNFRSTHLESKHRTSYRLLRSLAKKKIEVRQVEYLDERSIEIESAIKQHDPETAYSMVRLLREGKAKIENLPIIDKDGVLLTNSKERLDQWK